MDDKKSYQGSYLNHDSITTETRRALVELVEKQGYSVRAACKILLLNYTTGKALMSKYRRRGSIDRINKLRHFDPEAPKLL